ncbi:Transcription elongation factor GreA [subsurface metagenome]
MNVDKQNLSLGEAASRFLASLVSEQREVSQQEIYKFVRWFSREQPLAGLTPPEVANYAKQLSLSDTNYIKKFEIIRAFLSYASNGGWCQNNLATHFKTRLGKTRLPASTRQNLPQGTPLTQQGYAKMQAELEVLKSKRSQVINEIQWAAADKDFRENAPLEAAREEHGQLEGRIRGLEETLKSATIIGEKQKVALKVSIGDSILLCDVASGEELRYMIVSPREVDPTKGRISSASPIGKAVLGRAQDEIVEAVAPAGKLRYQIKQIER